MEKQIPLRKAEISRLITKWNELKASGKYPMETKFIDLVDAGEFTMQEALTLNNYFYPPSGTYYTGM